MAYAFTSTSSRYLSTSSTPVSGTPMTIACWCRATGNPQSLIAVGVSSGTHRNQLQVVAGPAVSAFAQGASASGSANSGSFSFNQWAHAAGVFSSATSRRAYANGVGGTANTANIGAMNAANSILIGARWATTLGLYFTGDIADVGVWGDALNDAEIASLAKGVSCRLIRPQSLVFYAPLIRDLVDVRGGLAITNNNGATVSDHPRIYA